MGRKSSLTPEQWIEVERLHVIEGKSINFLAKKYGVNESSIRRKIKPSSAESPNLRNPLQELAYKKVEVDNAQKEIAERIAELPYAKQQIVSELTRKLNNISYHLGSAAEYGAMTSHRLSGLANAQVEKIDDADPLRAESLETLKGIAALTRMANSSSEIGLNLLRANKEAIEDLNREQDKPEPKQIVFTVTDASA